jgi:hypothetical protein
VYRRVCSAKPGWTASGWGWAADKEARPHVACCCPPYCPRLGRNDLEADLDLAATKTEWTHRRRPIGRAWLQAEVRPKKLSAVRLGRQAWVCRAKIVQKPGRHHPSPGQPCHTLPSTVLNTSWITPSLPVDGIPSLPSSSSSSSTTSTSLMFARLHSPAGITTPSAFRHSFACVNASFLPPLCYDLNTLRHSL